MPITSYEDMKMKKKDILGYILDIEEKINNLSEIGLPQIDSRVLLDSKMKLENNDFKVLVIGEFKNGKSTFINALMGERLLPAASTPCTAVINEVVYGRDKKAVIYFKNPLPEEMSQDISEAALQHIRKYRNATKIPPYEIDVQELNAYVTIPDDTKNQADSIKEIPYSKVVLEYPVPICRDGIEIIDSPGLNEDETRSRVTEGYLNQADAILFVSRCPKIGSKDEVDYINKIREGGHKDIFIICNSIDSVDEEEREQFFKRGSDIFVPLTSLGEDGIFYVDSRKALKAKIKHDAEALSESGIPEFEAALSEYLRNNRGRMKLLQIVRQCISLIQKLCLEQIDGYAKGLNQDVLLLEKKIQLAEPNLKQAIQHKDDVSETINDAVGQMKEKVAEMLDQQYVSISMNRIPEYIAELDLDSKMTMNPFGQKKKKEDLEKEILSKINQFIQEEMGKWTSGELAIYMESFISNLETELGREIDQFYEQLDAFRYEISGVEKPKDISGFERVSATILGTLACGPTYGLIGATMGFKEVAQRSALTFAATALLALTPMGVGSIAASVVVLGLLQLKTGGKKLTDKYKKLIAENYIKEMQESRDVSIQEYTTKLSESMAERFAAIPQALQKEIDLEQDKIDALRKDKNSSENVRIEKLTSLNNIKTQLEDIGQQLIAMQKSIE